VGFRQILPFAAVCAAFTSFLTNEAAAECGEARFKAAAVFLLPYNDLLWRALLVLHWLFGDGKVRLPFLLTGASRDQVWNLLQGGLPGEKKKKTYRRTLVVVLRLAVLLRRGVLLLWIALLAVAAIKCLSKPVIRHRHLLLSSHFLRMARR
jgi:hypothetical protein